MVLDGGGVQGLASPTEYSFAAAALGDASRAAAGSGGDENLFADFTHGEGEGEGAGMRNEAGEALEGLGIVGRSEEEEGEEARKLADEFLTG